MNSAFAFRRGRPWPKAARLAATTRRSSSVGLIVGSACARAALLLAIGALASTAVPRLARADDAPAPPPSDPPAPARPTLTAPGSTAATPGPCERALHAGLADGPVGVGYYDVDFASGRRACPRTELFLVERLGAIIDTPNFYGAIAVDTLVGGSLAIGRRVEVALTVQALRFAYAQNASLSGTALSLGQSTASASVLAFSTEHLAITPYLRLLLPTATDTLRVRTVGGELGVALEYRPLRRLSVHGVVAGDVTAGLSGASPDVRGGALLLAGAQLAVASWFAVALDLQAQLGHRALFDLFAPALALRFRLHRGLGLDLAGTLPVLGADRHDALAQLRLQYRF